MNILVFEDNKSIRKLLIKIISSTFPTFTVESFPNAEDLEDFKNFESPALVFTDYAMGGKRDGIDVANFFAENHPNTPVIIYTGSEVKEPKGCFAVLSKPSAVNEITSAITQALEKNNLL